MKYQTMNIRQLRERAGMTVCALAAAMGVYTQVIKAWESEDYLPKTRDLPQLAAALGCSIDELYNKEVRA